MLTENTLSALKNTCHYRSPELLRLQVVANHMRIEYDRNTCIGMFQCVAEWD
ncbi:MAG: hypothetical protein J07HX5_00455, partial [halophilic archaeon J07HX5]